MIGYHAFEPNDDYKYNELKNTWMQFVSSILLALLVN